MASSGRIVGRDVRDERRRTRGRLVAAVALLGSLFVCIPGSAETPARADEPVRILIVGDSMTQGSAGDWTWRYRLWEYLLASHADVDFVGPSTDLYNVIDSGFGSHDYIDPSFDQDHAARWGLSMAFPDEHHSVSELVADYHPDVLVEMLGVNDLTWLQGTPDEMVSATSGWVASARAADPDVDIVVSRIAQPWIPAVAEFNDLLDDLAADLDTPGSRVLAAQSDVGMVRSEDTWDTFHPNAHGEIKIAAAVADSLAALGIGLPPTRPLPLAQTLVGPRLRPVLSATPALHGADLHWQRSPGAPETDVWLRDLTAGEGWHRVGDRTEEETASLTGLADWHRIEVKVLPVKGQAGPDDAFSNVVGLDVIGDRLAVPVPAVTSQPAGSAAVTWASVPGATSYTLQWRPADQPGAWQTQPLAQSSGRVTGLRNRQGYVFKVRAERGPLLGEFSTAVGTVVPALAPVRRAQVDRTAHGLRATGLPVPEASSYTLRVATSASCGRVPGGRRFLVTAAGLDRPQKRLRIDAPAVWVRWVAVRDGVEGDLARSSTDCVRVG